MKRIGVFDSGLGGLTVLRELIRTLPGFDYVYLGDTARTPYGAKSPETIIQYGRECAVFLLKQEIDLLVVACNTVSSHAFDVLRREFDCPIIGTIEPAVRACFLTLGRAHSSIGVIGTSGTIASEVYQQRLLETEPATKVHAIACPLFVSLVEEGMCEGEITDRVVAHYLSPFKNNQVSTVILGCTHYPLLRKAIANYLGPDVTLVECSEAISHEVSNLIGPGGKHRSGIGSRRYFVTDAVSRFNSLASLLIGGEKVEAIKIEQL